MTAEYELYVYRRTGELAHRLTDFRRLEYIVEVNAPGVCVFDVRGDHPVIATLEPDCPIEVWRRDAAAGLDWYRDFEGLFVDEERFADNDGHDAFRAICPGKLDLLGREIVAWPAATADRSMFNATPAEFIAKTLVEYNATAAATAANGRVYTTDVARVSVATSEVQGNTLTVYCAWRNLLEVLQEVARLGGGDFDLVSDGNLGYEWRWFVGQRGADRSATVRFALQYNNMANPVLRRGRLAEKTRVVAGGQGEGDARALAVRTGPTYDAGNNSKTVFLNASQYTTLAGVEYAGDVRLDELRARDELSFTVLQAPGTRYGQHYAVGDLVTGYYQGITATKKIVKATVTVEPARGESISIETVDV